MFSTFFHHFIFSTLFQHSIPGGFLVFPGLPGLVCVCFLFFLVLCFCVFLCVFWCFWSRGVCLFDSSLILCVYILAMACLRFVFVCFSFCFVLACCKSYALFMVLWFNFDCFLLLLVVCPGRASLCCSGDFWSWCFLGFCAFVFMLLVCLFFMYKKIQAFLLLDSFRSSGLLLLFHLFLDSLV